MKYADRVGIEITHNILLNQALGYCHWVGDHERAKYRAHIPMTTPAKRKRHVKLMKYYGRAMGWKLLPKNVNRMKTMRSIHGS